jgi:N-carbamoylputrescine amidase
MGRNVTLALLQHACTDDREQNLDKAVSMAREAASRGARIICTEELFSSMYFCQTVNPAYLDWAEPVPGPTTDRFQKLAKELSTVILCSFYEEAMPGVCYNTVTIFDADGTFLGKYRKTHIPEDPFYQEKYYFTPGDTGYPVFDTAFGRIGVLVCWDQWFPEAARVLALKGAEIIFYPTAIGEEDEDPPYESKHMWRDGVKAHGIHNNIFIAAVNRVGREESTAGFIDFFGHSFISNPQGFIEAEAKTDGDEIVTATIDLDAVRNERNIWFFLRDRRTDTYGPLLKKTLNSGD